jgi:hypothetical protein
LKQKLRFSGVGAKFQNGEAENAIKTICNMARANMLHATMSWPGRNFIDLWPFAIEYAVWVHNRLPPNGAGWSPEELWSRIKCHESHLPRSHVFGCPVYVLDPKLQDGKAIPKWDSKARQGIFVGFSTEHSTNVPLILNPKTQHISPQFHVIFDDDFTTVPAISDELARNQEFERLFELSKKAEESGSWRPCERYVDSSDLDATDDPLLGDEWLSDEDLEIRNKRRQEAIARRMASLRSNPSASPEGAVPELPEGAIPEMPEGAATRSPHALRCSGRPTTAGSDSCSSSHLSSTYWSQPLQCSLHHYFPSSATYHWPQHHRSS